MTKAPMHTVIIFKTCASGGYIWDGRDQAVVEHQIKMADLAEAEALVRKTIAERDSVCAANLNPAVERFDNLTDYIHALNTKSRISEDFPREGTFISALVDDISHWADIGVFTPLDLADYLDGCFKREMDKNAFF